jgi:hypothetical protein
MHQNKKFIAALLPFLILYLLGTHGYAQQDKSDKEAVVVQEMVDAKRFVFQAQSAMPMRGGVVQLSQGYGMSISPDSIQCYLPYFGRVYTPPMNSSDGGLKFVSTKFDYSVKNRKRGGWDITLVINDIRNYQKLNISIFSTGKASVRVTCTDRESISYNGSLKNKK